MQAAEQVQRGSREGSEGSREGLGGFGAEPGQVQQGSGERSEKVPGNLGAKISLSQVQQGSGEGSGEGPEKVPEKVWEASVQSQVRFNRVPEKSQVKFNRVLEKVPEKVCMGGFGATSVSTGFRKRFRRALVQSQVRFNRILEKLWEALVAEPGQVRDLRPFNSREAQQGCFQRLALQHASERFESKTWRLLGIPPKSTEAYLFIYLFTYLFVYLFTSLFLSLFIDLFISLPLSLSLTLFLFMDFIDPDKKNERNIPTAGITLW